MTIDTAVMAALREKFSMHELNLALREARYATSWVYITIKQLATEEIMLRA